MTIELQTHEQGDRLLIAATRGRRVLVMAVVQPGYCECCGEARWLVVRLTPERGVCAKHVHRAVEEIVFQVAGWSQAPLGCIWLARDAATQDSLRACGLRPCGRSEEGEIEFAQEEVR